MYYRETFSFSEKSLNVTTELHCVTLGNPNIMNLHIKNLFSVLPSVKFLHQGSQFFLQQITLIAIRLILN